MKKENILFIHGFPMSKKIWKSQLNVLKELYNCYAIDLPGYGENKVNEDFVHSIESYTKYVYNYVLDVNSCETDPPNPAKVTH